MPSENVFLGEWAQTMKIGVHVVLYEVWSSCLLQTQLYITNSRNRADDGLLTRIATAGYYLLLMVCAQWSVGDILLTTVTGFIPGYTADPNW